MIKKKKQLNKQSNKQQLNKQILLVTYIFMGLFLILAGYFAYLAGYSSKNVINNPYNKLQNLLSESVVRGNIYSSDGELLATTVTDDEGNESRYYPLGQEFCHIVGSVDKGLYGLESSYNFELLSSSISPFLKIANDFSGKKDPGDSIVTTLNAEIQHTVNQAMSSYDGAAIVMDSKTGDVLAMVSNPGYDPNDIAEDWEDIQSSESSVLLNRATQGLYTPGSIFKIITLYAYLEQGGSEEDYSYDCTGSVEVDGQTIRCNNSTAHGTVDLKDSFAYSCNCSFINLGKQISAEQMQKAAKKLLFGQKLPLNVESNQSRFSLKKEDTDFMKAQTMFGQGETLMSPMHAAMIVSAVANDGTAVRPKFVREIKNVDGKVVKTEESRNYKQLFQPEMAEKLKDYMRSVVEYGTAQRLNQYENLTVYGKTGSAEIDSERNFHSWFVGFAENEKTDDNYTIVVITEKMPHGTSPAPSVTIANQILKVLD